MLPVHIAIIMDGNGRWATNKLLPRTCGHMRGVRSVRRVVKWCLNKGVKYLTLYTFSTENWLRPAVEVNFLTSLFEKTLDKEVNNLHKNNIKLKIIGELVGFDKSIVDKALSAECLTKSNTGLVLTIAANYGGKWDIISAVKKALIARSRNYVLENPDSIVNYLSTAGMPDPDLLIRPGGEFRLSNFLTWQTAHSELYFTKTLWPDFDDFEMDVAINWYQNHLKKKFI